MTENFITCESIKCIKQLNSLHFLIKYFEPSTNYKVTKNLTSIITKTE